MKTKRRIIFFIGLTITVSFLFFSQFISHYLTNFAKKQAFVVADEASIQQTQLVKKELEAAVSLSVFLSIAVENALTSEVEDVQQVDRLLQKTLSETHHLFSTWVVWEENINGSPKGYYTSFFHRKKGKIVKDSIFYDRHKDKAYPVLKQSKESLIIDHFFYDRLSLFSSDKISFATPIIVDGEYKGAVGVDMETKQIEQLIGNIEILSFGYASLLNGELKYVAHGNETMRGRSLYDELSNEDEKSRIHSVLFKKNEILKDEHNSETLPDKEYRIYSPLKLENTAQTWYFVVNIRLKDIVKPVDAIANKILLMSVVALVIIIIIVNFVISYVIQPIVQMARLLGDLAHGKPITEEIKVSFKDEIGEMNHNFVKLVQALEEKAKAERALLRAKDKAEIASYKLQTLNRELEARVDQRTASLAKEIEERKSVQVALQESEASYRNLVQNSFQGLIIYDRNEILYVNQRLLEIFARREDELMSMNVEDFFRLHHPEEAHIIHSKLDYVDQDPDFTGRYIYRIIQKNGAIRWVEDYSSTINYNGKRAVQVVLLDVHERKIVEKDLAEYRKFLKRIIDNNPNLIFVKDLQYRYVLANKAMAEITGNSVEQMIGKTDSELNVDEAQLKEFNKAETEAAHSLQQQILPISTFQNQYGEKRFFQTVKVPLLNSNGICKNVLTVVTDITTRHKAEEKAKRSEASIRQILNSIHDAIIVHDRDLNIVDTNEKVEKLFGITRDEARKMKLTDLAPRRMSYARIKKVFRNLRFDEPRFFELRGVKPTTKELFDVEVFISKVHVFGDDYFLSAVRDITERKQFEAALEKAKTEAEQANLTKGEFLANMSNEIRTPMNAIIGFTELLDKTEASPKQRHYIESIKSGSKSLLTVINDILDLARIEAGKLEIRPEPTNTHVLFKEIEQIFVLKVEEKKLDLILDIDPKLPKSLMLDEIRLRQVIFNLMGNAVRFTEQGFVKLTAKRIKIEDNTTKVNLEISISDSGIGIQKSRQKEIFEAFSQRSEDKPHFDNGTGLGLSISRRLVHMMGGELKVESDGKTGSIFSFTLYGVTISEQKANNETLPVETSGLIAFEPATVLIVDDVKTNREYLMESLRHTPLKLVTAADGQEAVEMTQRYLPDVVLLDVRMPVMDGYQAIEQIKANPQTSFCKVIALTASVFGQEIKRIEAYRFDDFLRKPIHLQDLYEMLAKYIPHKRIPTEASLGNLFEQAEIDPVVARECLLDFEERALSFWEKAKDLELSEDIEQFSRLVADIAGKYQIRLLEEYSKKLKAEVENFELDQMTATIKNFQRVLDKLNFSLQK